MKKRKKKNWRPCGHQLNNSALHPTLIHLQARADKSCCPDVPPGPVSDTHTLAGEREGRMHADGQGYSQQMSRNHCLDPASSVGVNGRQHAPTASPSFAFPLLHAKCPCYPPIETVTLIKTSVSSEFLLPNGALCTVPTYRWMSSRGALRSDSHVFSPPQDPEICPFIDRAFRSNR